MRVAGFDAFADLAACALMLVATLGLQLRAVSFSRRTDLSVVECLVVVERIL